MDINVLDPAWVHHAIDQVPYLLASVKSVLFISTFSRLYNILWHIIIY